MSCELRKSSLRVPDDVHDLDKLAAHGEHQHVGQFPAGEGKHRGLTLVGTPVALNEYYVEVQAGPMSAGFSKCRFTEYCEDQATRADG